MSEDLGYIWKDLPYYLILFIISGSEYDRRSFDYKRQAVEHFNWLHNLPARDHHWDRIQLWEISETEGVPSKLLDEKKGLC